MDPMKRNGCWGIMAIDSLRVLSPTSDKSTPSMRMLPPLCLSFSTILKRAWSTEDFPAPVLPTIPTFIFPSIANESLFKTGSN